MSRNDRRNIAGFFIGGAITFTVGLTCLLPASLIDGLLKTNTGGIVRLADAHGTVWAGEGYVELRDNGQPVAPQQHVTWRFSPNSVLGGHLQFTLTLNQSAQPTSVLIGISSITLRNTTLQLPAATLSLAIPKLAPLGLQGDLSIAIDDVQFAENQTAGNARLKWMRAGSKMTNVSPLGNYQAELLTQGSMISVALSTVEGPLQLDGKGSWAIQAAPNFSGTARVPSSLQQQLSPILRLIATERVPGEFEIQIW
jgi:general secretion pathway protein N